MEWGILGGMNGWRKDESLRKLRIIHSSDHELNDEWLDEKIEGVMRKKKEGRAKKVARKTLRIEVEQKEK